MGQELRGKRVAILAADGVERVELQQPRDELTSAGARTDLLSLEPGDIQAVDSDLEPAATFTVDAWWRTPPYGTTTCCSCPAAR